jgi:hypothetical protein
MSIITSEEKLEQEAARATPETTPLANEGGGDEGDGGDVQ